MELTYTASFRTADCKNVCGVLRGDWKMSIKKLGLSPNLVDLLTNKWGIKELYPPQQKALPAALSGKNIMLTIPTASGKSLVAHLTIAHRLKNDLEGQKALYIVPLKALATEKYNELKEIADTVDLKVGLAIGDRSGENNSIEYYG